ncbi:MAG: hypothetical protein IIA40_09045 [SAR324 cluster bacterium]|nr:hypothetical protein [SAR324 cluster bacterium]
MTNKKYVNRLIAIVAAVMLLPSAVLAQDDGPGYIQVRTMIVKSGRVADFLKLQADFAKAEKAAGMSRDFWQEVRGNGSAFHAVRTLDKLGDNDAGFQAPLEGEDWTKWVAALTDTMASSTYQILRTYPGHNIPLAEDAELNLMLLRFRTVAPVKFLPGQVAPRAASPPLRPRAKRPAGVARHRPQPVAQWCAPGRLPAPRQEPAPPHKQQEPAREQKPARKQRREQKPARPGWVGKNGQPRQHGVRHGPMSCRSPP